MMRGTLRGFSRLRRLWAGCGALVLALHAGGAWSQNAYEVGRDYKASIPIYAADFQKVLYTIPIPAGDWRLISHELLRTTSGHPMQTLMLVAIDRQKVQAYLSMRVYAEENPTRRWNDEPCKVDAIYKNDHGKRLWEQQCLRINRQAYLPNADTTFRKQSIEYLNRNKITWDTGPIVMNYGQFGDQGKLMFVEYGVFPENFGFANPRVPTAVQSPWHFTVATAEPDRKAFIDAFVRYAEDYSKLLEKAYKKESVQGSPALFAFDNPNPVTRVAQASTRSSEGAATRTPEAVANSSRVEAELRARLEQEARARVEAEAKIKAETEARVAAEARAKSESEARERLAREQREREGQEGARLAAEKTRIEADARARAEADLRDRLAREQREKTSQESARLAEEKARAESDARARAESSARQRLAQEQKERDARDARENQRVAALAAENDKLRQQLARAEASAPGIRKALVIGNDGYRFVPKLQNAIEDAKALAESLAKVGYSVTLKTDLTEKDMKAALRVFKGLVNPGDEVAIFYAGHGVQLGAANYLLPVDVGGDNEEQVRDEAIPLQRILDDMSEKKAKFTLAMLDACRDNPFKGQGRSVGGNTRGLAPTSAATGQMVVFSAGTGQQALDRLGPADKNRNGLFTRVFLREMQKPGVSIDKIVRNVRTEVVNLAKTIGHDQVPAIYDQVVGDFFFLR
jgi:hypothetical protein